MAAPRVLIAGGARDPCLLRLRATAGRRGIEVLMMLHDDETECAVAIEPDPSGGFWIFDTLARIGPG